jgi:hypothetical protein
MQADIDFEVDFPTTYGIDDLPRFELPKPKRKPPKPTILPKPDYWPGIHILDF